MDYAIEPTTGSNMNLVSGGYFDLLYPDPAKVTLADIAHALSHLARFNGHTPGGPLTVAQHSVLVAELVQQIDPRPDIVALALLHDAHEAYVGDITYPVAQALRALSEDEGGVSQIAVLKNRIQRAILVKLLPFATTRWAASTIKLADTAALVLEKEAFMPAGATEPWFTHDEFLTHFDRDAVNAAHRIWTHAEARGNFLKMAHDLGIEG